MAKSLVITILVCFLGSFTFAKDSTKVDTSSAYVHHPKRSALFSLFPAGGQIYNEYGYRQFGKKNRAWWKVPLIYGALGTSSYFYYKNYQTTQLLKKEILYRQEFGEQAVYDERFINYSSVDSLINGYTEYGVVLGTDTMNVNHLGFDDRARRRDLLMFATIGIYGLQILEAYVDGHFVSFDISDDLSLSWYPRMVSPTTPGIGLTLSFK
jgi:hypothetical protein